MSWAHCGGRCGAIGAALAVVVLGTNVAWAQVATDVVCVGCVNAGDISAGAITTGKLSTGAVTTDKLRAEAVDTARLAGGAVTTEKLRNGAVRPGKLADAAVITDKIRDGAVTGPKISGSIAIAAVGMQPTADDVEYLKQTGNGYVWLDGATTNATFVAPVSLPAGAVITAIRCLCYDNLNPGMVQVRLVRMRRSPANFTESFTVGAAATSDADTVTSVLLSADGLAETVLAGPEYSYFAEVFLSANSGQLGFFAVAVDYGVP